MSRSLGCAMPLPWPTNVDEGVMLRAPADGTPPSPSMKPSPPASFDIGIIDQRGTEVGAVAAAAVAAGRLAATTDARARPMITRGRMRPPYVMTEH
ncbi:unannotated protein [freshwater metagenome]|uniref:Unannotated protein n=1 Tax=freshwater metagenome TaxID=449393 RepID=A0A6J7ESR8_9ZZZZ